jgi:phytoene dehydrogenase-like protein
MLRDLWRDCEENCRALQSHSSDLCDMYRETVENARKRLEVKLRELVTSPPHHDRHFERLREFYRDGKFEESVFVMTKYPDGKEKEDRELLAWIPTHPL